MAQVLRVVRAAGRGIRETLLTLAALGGAACIVLVILAFTGGFSLIMFKTGSMTPTIPAGSVALVQKVPAAGLRVGDVVTVDRAGQLPVTHRIRTIADGPAPSQRILVLRGDANASDDPAPYTVEQVRIVRGSMPYLAYVIVWFGNPWVLGGITLAAALLVGWAFWPRDEGRSGKSTASRGAPSQAVDAPDDAPSTPVALGDDAPALELAAASVAGHEPLTRRALRQDRRT